MSVTKFNPNTVLPVSFTEQAIVHLESQVKKQSAKGIIFNVKESGCSGFKYLLELAFEFDVPVREYALSDSLTLFINTDIIKLIQGTQVDYIQEGVNRRLDFKNPNATANCGCGESFSVEQQA